MGVEQSNLCNDTGPSLNLPSTKPNKIKKYNHFHSKPSYIVDLIVNKDWQRLLIATTTHQKEVFVSHKVRLFGVDRKVLPLHLACAMSPPPAVIEALLKVDRGLVTVKTTMKNYKKKMGKVNSSNGGGNGNHLSQKIDTKPMDCDEDTTKSLSDVMVTPTTEPLSSFDCSEIWTEEVPTSNSSQSSEYTSHNFFFPENYLTDYALQITPSGDVRQICPNRKHFKFISDTESPFIHVTQRDEEKQMQQLCIADDFLPLHIACLFKASPAVIELLIKAYPTAVECKNKWGMLPIHIVCGNVSAESPKIASKKAVDEFTARRYLNNLYFDTMSERNDDWNLTRVVKILVDSFPDSLNIPSDNVEWLTPIEYAGKNFPSGQDREQLLDLLKSKLHSSRREDDSNIVTDLPQSMDANVKLKEKPLLYSYLKLKDWESARHHLCLHPDEATCWVTDKDYDHGSPHLPIHVACSQCAPIEIIQGLMKANPAGIKAKGMHGFTPLHIACKKKMSEETILEIIRQYPGAASRKDEYGRFPLHLACKNNLPLPVVKALIETYPESCAIKDYNGHTAITYFYINNDSKDDDIAPLFERYDRKYRKQSEEPLCEV